jgi:ABC-type cobalamin/Fe3+-siderophores transport system ATPase subunit
MEKLKIKNIAFKYDKNDVLNNINADIINNSIISIIGNNGAGKSSILKIILKIITQNSGEIFIDEQLNKNINDQIQGYWSGHSAYSIMVKGGFLINEKKGAKKELTELGKRFIKDFEFRGK